MILTGDLRNLNVDGSHYICSLIDNKKYSFDCFLKSLAPPWYLKRDMESGMLSREEFLSKYREYLHELKDPDFSDSLLLLERLSTIIDKTIVIVDANDYSQSLRRMICEEGSEITTFKEI